MDNPVLTKKRKIHTSDGEMLDLSLSTVDKRLLYVVDNMHFVQEEETARLDSIANLYYGWADKLDAILWANDIFNPFAIEEHTWLMIPRVKDNNMYAVDPKESKMPETNSQSVTSKITSAAEKLNKNASTAKEERNKQRAKRKSNEMTPGETYKKVDGAVIHLG